MEYFECNICCETAWDFAKCCANHHRVAFCKSCLLSWLKTKNICPMCNETATSLQPDEKRNAIIATPRFARTNRGKKLFASKRNCPHCHQPDIVFTDRKTHAEQCRPPKDYRVREKLTVVAHSLILAWWAFLLCHLVVITEFSTKYAFASLIAAGALVTSFIDKSCLTVSNPFRSDTLRVWILTLYILTCLLIVFNVSFRQEEMLAKKPPRQCCEGLDVHPTPRPVVEFEQVCYGSGNLSSMFCYMQVKNPTYELGGSDYYKSPFITFNNNGIGDYNSLTWMLITDILFLALNCRGLFVANRFFI